jgi:SAM-dependent methyltransferase
MTIGPAYRLFGAFAARYDWHTPPGHYRHDHAFVLAEAAALATGRPARLLDIGCGTGVLLEKALAAGLDAFGIDLSPEMVALAARRAGSERVATEPMEGLSAKAAFDCIAALSWVIHYAVDEAALLDVLKRCHRALAPGGSLLLQVAHAANFDGRVREDREPGPGGEPGDVVFLYQFETASAGYATARYVFASKSLGELLFEEHRLAAADAATIAGLAAAAGFGEIHVFNSWRREPLTASPSPWVTARRPA